MMKIRNKVFLDTSVIFAAALSKSGGARVLFRLGEAGVLQLVVGSNVLRESEQVVRRKAPSSLPTLAYLLELGKVEIANPFSEDLLQKAKAFVAYELDAHVLAEALAVEPDWFITHDKAHFLDADPGASLNMRIGTPGDLIQALEDEFTRS